jgi:hypothetical protein
MKRRVLALSFLILLTITSGYASMGLFNVNQSNIESIEIEFSLDEEYEFLINEVDGVSYTRIHHPEAGFIMEEGLPELPVFSTMIAIPATGTVSFGESTILDSQTITDINIFPSQGPDLVVDNEKGFIINRDFYESDSSYPQIRNSVSSPGILRNHRVVTITVTPFVYNPALQELVVNRNIRFQVNFDRSTTGENEITGPPRKLSRSFENLYRSMILNYEQVRDNSLQYQQRSILVVYHHSPTIVPTVNQYLNWKRDKGFYVDAVNTSNLANANAIKNYIQNAYDNSDHPPEYIVIIGGGPNTTIHIPYFMAHSGPGDHPYGLLEGGDDYPDVFVGRISVADNTQLATFWNKLNNYERTPYLDDNFWYRNAILVGDQQVSGVSTIFNSKYIKLLMQKNASHYTFTEIYNAPFASQINNAINQGGVLYSYRGLENMSGWTPNSGSIYNGLKLVNFSFITCHTLDFLGNKQTEPLFRMGTPTTPKGAMSGIGMSTNLTATAYNNCLNGGIFYGIFVDNMRTMGEALVRGKLYLHKVYDIIHPTYPPQYSQWANLIGDPSMDIWVDVPKPLNVQYDDVLPIGSTYVDITVTDGGENPVENAWVTIRKSDDSFFTTGYTDQNGQITHFLDPDIIGEINVTVTKPDYIPHIDSISLSADPAVSFYEDIAGDPYIAGTNVETLIRIKNYTDETIYGVSGILSSDSPYLEIINNESEFGQIEPDSVATSLTSFLVSFMSNTPDYQQVVVNLTLTDLQGSSWDSRFAVQVNGSNLQPIVFIVDDNDNGVLDPDETASLRVTVKNEGQTSVQDVYAALRTKNPLISIFDSLAFIGDIEVDEVVTSYITNSFGVTAMEALLPGMKIDFDLYFYNNSGFNALRSSSLTIGEVTVNDPLGPDNYGYYIYDMEDTDYEYTPEYDWIEIAPTLGGNGVNTGLQSDWNNQQQVMSMDLPFTFKFYGAEYDVISICANGWISFGPTDIGEQRNWRLPGPLGPSPIIAAFWDNLSLSQGGVYTYHHEDLDAFIIQWQNAKNIVGSAEATFQIILYNPELEDTVNDGIVKIQYKVFNNVNNGMGFPHGNWGNYATIGIQDYTGTDGLEYTFANQYPVAASPLSNETALLIVGPKNFNDPFLLLDDIIIFDENGNGQIDAGENVRLGIYIKNIGYAPAESVIGSISTTSPYLQMINTTSPYYDIESGDKHVNINFFEFNVSSATPTGHVANFAIDIEYDHEVGQISFPFQFAINKPDIVFSSYMISEVMGNNDGIINPEETINLALSVSNNSVTEAVDAVLNLSSASDYITINQTQQNLGVIPAHSTIQTTFEVHINDDCPAGEMIPFSILLSATNISTFNRDFMVGVETEDLFFDFEDDDGGFVSNNPEGWQWGTPNITPYSGDNVWGTVLLNNYADNANWLLESPDLLITPATNLSFFHKFNIEHYWDGGNLKLSTDGGSIWQLIYPYEGYPVSQTNSGNTGIPNQPAYSGESNGWEEASFDLSQCFGQLANIRWHFGSGPWVNDTGWFIDDLTISGSNPLYGTITGTIELEASPFSPEFTIVKAGDFSVRPDVNGYYELILPPGEYQISADSPFHIVDTVYESITVEELTTVSDIDFSLTYLTPPENLYYTYDHDNHEVHLTWNYYPLSPSARGARNKNDRDDEAVFVVYRQQDSGHFLPISYTEEEEFTDVIPVIGSVFRYYIVAEYLDGVSDKSNMVSTDEEPQVVEDLPSLSYTLQNNYPNPFNPITNIAFSIPTEERVEIRVYNIKGELVKVLTDRVFQDGNHTVQWNGTNNRNRAVSSGIYFYRMKTINFTDIKKALLLK